MYICVCAAVTERQIHQAALNGVSSMKDLGRELGVARECGRCATCARQCLREVAQNGARTLSVAIEC